MWRLFLIVLASCAPHTERLVPLDIEPPMECLDGVVYTNGTHLICLPPGAQTEVRR